MRYAVIEKHEGETPLMAIESWRKQSMLGEIPLTYAGRLDPMATGKLLVLVGDECKKRAHYDGLDKEYRVEILFGLSSDTGDILGLVEEGTAAPRLSLATCEEGVRAVSGTVALPYPAYSSKTIGGTPLFEYARTGTLETIDIPTKISRVYASECDAMRTVRGAELLKSVEQRLGLLTVDAESKNPFKDFRKEEVLQRWRDVIDTAAEYQVASAYFVVSSGTYIRSLVPHIGRTMGIHALAYSIHRTRIGKYLPLWGHGVWMKSY